VLATREATVKTESNDFSISSEPGATPEDVAAIREALHRYNFSATELTEHHDVALLARDRQGIIKGGLLGYVWGGWLHITDLWVAEDCRRRGLGRELLERAEREASACGARGVFLSTFDFQAPDFYRRYGYEVYATLANYPPGHTHYHMRKKL
jgi:ribosomal protein S18 acetylase RimI-like enzyme